MSHGFLGDSPDEVARDIAAMAGLSAIPTILRIVCEMTNLEFSAVARVTETTWTACAVHDALATGIKPGHQLPVRTTPSPSAIPARTPITIDRATIERSLAEDSLLRRHNVESYIAVPIILMDGRYFGELLAFDRTHVAVSDPRFASMFSGFARLIAVQLESALTRSSENAALLDERAASELREQFIAILGHDLRNPLAAVSASGELLARRLTDPALVGIAQRIGTNVKRMSALIDDVLDFARGRLGGGLGVQIRETDAMDTAINAVVRELQEGQPTRRVITEVSVAKRVRCDLGRVQQLVSNLVANALTHGSEQGVVRVSAKADADSLNLEVWNDGEPIPPESVDKIFGPFWRRSISPSREGLGLGLHICSEIVKAHGGTIAVTSSREIGTRFTVRIPLGTAAAA